MVHIMADRLLEGSRPSTDVWWQCHPFSTTIWGPAGPPGWNLIAFGLFNWDYRCIHVTLRGLPSSQIPSI